MGRAFVLFAFVGCVQSNVVRSSPLAAKHLSAGVTALEAADLPRARAELELALEYEPDMPEALNALGLVAHAHGDRERAAAYFVAAITANDDLAEAHANLGAIAMEDERHEEAISHLRAALDIDPGYQPARRNLAQVHWALGQLMDARDEYLKLSSLEPENADIWAELASVELALGNRAATGRAVAAALSLNCEHLSARHTRASLLRLGGDLTSALGEYDALLALAPGNAQLHIDKGTTLIMMGRPDTAETSLRQAVLLAPTLANGHCALGLALALQGDAARAAVRFEEALALAKRRGRSYPEAALLLASQLEALGRRGDAIRAVEAVVNDTGAVSDLREKARSELSRLRR